MVVCWCCLALAFSPSLGIKVVLFLLRLVKRLALVLAPHRSLCPFRYCPFRSYTMPTHKKKLTKDQMIYIESIRLINPYSGSAGLV